MGNMIWWCLLVLSYVECLPVVCIWEESCLFSHSRLSHRTNRFPVVKLSAGSRVNTLPAWTVHSQNKMLRLQKVCATQHLGNRGFFFFFLFSSGGNMIICNPITSINSYHTSAKKTSKIHNLSVGFNLHTRRNRFLEIIIFFHLARNLHQINAQRNVCKFVHM